MKKINYKGSLLKNFKKTEGNYNFITFLKKNKAEFWLLVLIIIMIIVTNLFSSLPLASIIACYAYSFMQLHKRYNEAKKDFYKEQDKIKDEINVLGEESLNEKKLYKALKRAKVFEHTNIKEEMDLYLEYITSDIYYINNEDKIAVLREVKSYTKYKGGCLAAKDISLYKLEGDEITNKKELPVRQVLKLRKDFKS